MSGLRPHSSLKIAFTFADVLITLGIIGVVAAMTIPTLLQNRVNTEVESKLKKVYSLMNQAILMSEQDNGPKEYWEFSCTQDGDGNFDDFEPYKWDIRAANLTKEFLTSEGSGYTCNKNFNNKAYCTVLIQLNGWKIPKDYPFKVR